MKPLLKIHIVVILFFIFISCSPRKAKNISQGVITFDDTFVPYKLPPDTSDYDLTSMLITKNATTFYDKAKLPVSIKNYYAIHWEDGFNIANRGENWDAGCCRPIIQLDSFDKHGEKSSWQNHRFEP